MTESMLRPTPSTATCRPFSVGRGSRPGCRAGAPASASTSASPSEYAPGRTRSATTTSATAGSPPVASSTAFTSTPTHGKDHRATPASPWRTPTRTLPKHSRSPRQSPGVSWPEKTTFAISVWWLATYIRFHNRCHSERKRRISSAANVRTIEPRSFVPQDDTTSAGEQSRVPSLHEDGPGHAGVVLAGVGVRPRCTEREREALSRVEVAAVEAAVTRRGGVGGGVVIGPGDRRPGWDGEH